MQITFALQSYCTCAFCFVETVTKNCLALLFAQKKPQIFFFSGMNAASFGDIHHRFAKSDVSPWIPCVQTGGSTSLAWGIEPSLWQTKEIYHPPEERTWHPFGISLGGWVCVYAACGKMFLSTAGLHWSNVKKSKKFCRVKAVEVALPTHFREGATCQCEGELPSLLIFWDVSLVTRYVHSLMCIFFSFFVIKDISDLVQWIWTWLSAYHEPSSHQVGDESSSTRIQVYLFWGCAAQFGWIDHIQ